MLFLAVILPTRQWTSYCTQTDIQTDTNIQSRYKEIDKQEEKEKGGGPEADFEQKSCNCNWKMAVEIQKEGLNCKQAGQQRCDQ